MAMHTFTRHFLTNPGILPTKLCIINGETPQLSGKFSTHYMLHGTVCCRYTRVEGKPFLCIVEYVVSVVLGRVGALLYSYLKYQAVH